MYSVQCGAPQRVWWGGALGAVWGGSVTVYRGYVVLLRGGVWWGGAVGAMWGGVWRFDKCIIPFNCVITNGI